jgi:hypothetical protein
MKRGISGIIYELRYFEGTWIPFYVGETYHGDKRKAEHIYCGKVGKKLPVYAYIQALNDRGRKWDLFPVDTYDAGGPENKEDEHIMKNLMAGISLLNAKKGNANWMNNRIKAAPKMKKLGIKTYKEWNAYEVAQKTIKKNEERAEKERLKQKRQQWKEQARKDAKPDIFKNWWMGRPHEPKKSNKDIVTPTKLLERQKQIALILGMDKKEQIDEFFTKEIK